MNINPEANGAHAGNLPQNSLLHGIKHDARMKDNCFVEDLFVEVGNENLFFFYTYCVKTDKK